MNKETMQVMGMNFYRYYFDKNCLNDIENYKRITGNNLGDDNCYFLDVRLSNTEYISKIEKGE